MADQEKKLSGSKNKKKKFYGLYTKRMKLGRTIYKSKVAELEDNTINAASNPTKLSKLLKNIKNYIQKTYRSPNDMVKTLQQMKRVSLSYPTKPRKQDQQCCDQDGNPNLDADYQETTKKTSWLCGKGCLSIVRTSKSLNLCFSPPRHLITKLKGSMETHI